jgi:hypothetical protein
MGRAAAPPAMNSNPSTLVSKTSTLFFIVGPPGGFPVVGTLEIFVKSVRPRAGSLAQSHPDAAGDASAAFHGKARCREGKCKRHLPALKRFGGVP